MKDLPVPKVIHRVAPKVTAELRAHMPAIVWLAFVVDQDGDVSSPQVVRSTDPRFEASALAAIEQWRFEPGTRDGAPLVMEHRLAIPFVDESPGHLTEFSVELSGRSADMEESVASPAEVVIAITADGRVIYGGREVGVDGVRPLVERLLSGGDRPIVLQVDAGADPKLWSRVEAEAKRGGAASVDVQLLLGVALEDLDSKPRVLHQPAPKLTAELRERTPAKVMVRFLVDERGRVTDPVVESSTDEAFHAAALEAVKAWRFEPGRRDGQPVAFRMRMPVTFPAAD